MSHGINRRVAVLFHRIGPYHFARLKAAGQRLNTTAIELSGADNTYAWEPVSGADTFHRVTLFEHADSHTQPTAEVVRRVNVALDACRPEVVAIPGWSDPAALGALRWCVKQRVPAIVMSESTACDHPRVWWKESVKRKIVNTFASGLVGGRPHREYLVKLGMSPSRIFLGYDAVDNKYFAQGANEVTRKKEECRKKKGLPERYFLASARFVEKKNLPRLLQAYALYRRKTEDRRQKTDDSPPSSVVRSPSSDVWSLVLLGDGPLKSDLCRLIYDLQLQHSVLLPGFKQYPDLPAYYGLASAFVHASTTEPWGLVVNEAMASGLRVLVSIRCGCATDLVRDGVNGFTFDPCDIEAQANLMHRVASMPEAERLELGAKSREIIANWGPDRFADGLKQAVDCALKAGPKRATMLDRLLLRSLVWWRR